MDYRYKWLVGMNRAVDQCRRCNCLIPTGSPT